MENRERTGVKLIKDNLCHKGEPLPCSSCPHWWSDDHTCSYVVPWLIGVDLVGNLTKALEPIEKIFKEKLMNNKYRRTIRGETVDVYDVLLAFNVTNPALQHLIKKALCAGLRGHKDRKTDLEEILSAAKRALELEGED